MYIPLYHSIPSEKKTNLSISTQLRNSTKVLSNVEREKVDTHTESYQTETAKRGGKKKKTKQSVDETHNFSETISISVHIVHQMF
jgi:hypothetical protein